MDMPWLLKIAAKVVLSRLPLDYRVWADLGAFKHGAMASIAYPQRVFREHMGLGRDFGFDPAGSRIIELGPGDAVSTALLARKAGAASTVLIDTGPFATRDMAHYYALARDISLPLPPDMSFDEMLAQLDSTYLTEGLGSWHQVKDNSVDYIFSHAVIEHVRRGEFAANIDETFRALRPGGLASHNIDLKDHLGGSLNNLRFSHTFWEQDWFAFRSGFYTNRLRPSELLAHFSRAGFEIISNVVAKFSEPSTARSVIHADFQALDDEDLNASGLRVLLRKPL